MGQTEDLLNDIRTNTHYTHLMGRWLTSRTLYNINNRSEAYRNPFNNYGKKSFSQTDEDGLTFEIIRRLGIQKGVFAELGAGNGIENNTLALAALKWRGFWVGNENLAVNINPSNEPKLNLAYVKYFVDLDNIITLMQTGMNLIAQQKLDLISFDLDGNDFYLVEKILRARPEGS